MYFVEFTLNSTKLGVKFPSLTWTQVQAISNPANGLRLFCTTYNTFLTNLGTPAAPKWMAEQTAELATDSTVQLELLLQT